MDYYVKNKKGDGDFYSDENDQLEMSTVCGLASARLLTNKTGRCSTSDNDKIDNNGNLTDSISTVLSGDRVSQMTNTYADVDCLKGLLEEKEKDLELAARIGQQLLQENTSLRQKLSSTESSFASTSESLTQLKHELMFKTQLLELYKEDVGGTTPAEEVKPFGIIGKISNVLEKRVGLLEEENQFLRVDVERMVAGVEKAEAEEKLLVDDAIRRLASSTSRLNTLTTDLEKKCEESLAQQDEIEDLTEELKALKGLNREVLGDNAQLNIVLEEMSTEKGGLAEELLDLKDNYLQVVAILKETQDQLREARAQRESGADAVSVFDSLAYEIDSSVARQRRSSDYFRRAFDMVRRANTTGVNNGHLHSSILSTSSSGYASNSDTLDSSSHSLHQVSTDFSSDRFWRLPEKLQIIKPLEGSSTLQVWSLLATPNLNLLEKRPGVHCRVENSGLAVMDAIVAVEPKPVFMMAGSNLSSDYLLKCDTPQNSPEGSRPASPSGVKEDNNTFQTLYSVYDSLVGRLSGLGPSSQFFKTSGFEKAKTTYNLTARIGDLAFEKSRREAPPRPGAGVMDKILRDSLK